MRYTSDQVDAVASLLGGGASDYEIARRTGVERTTVWRWRTRGLPSGVDPESGPWSVHDPEAYSYLLGCYLGDGYVLHRPPNGWTLKLACDRAYPNVMAEIMTTAERVFAPRRARRTPNSVGAADVVSLSHPAVRDAFPQHGAGPKHLRPIVLADWQREITACHPGALVRGLIHSDGCRSINTVRTRLPSGRDAEYHYVRYFFTNYSADIRAIFIEHCELLGVRVTQSSAKNLSVAKRQSVAILDRHVGPKT